MFRKYIVPEPGNTGQVSKTRVEEPLISHPSANPVKSTPEWCGSTVALLQCISGFRDPLGWRQVRSSLLSPCPLPHPKATYFDIIRSTSTWFYIFLHSSTQFYIVLHSSTQFYPILHNYTQFYIVLHSSIQFYIVLHSSTQFYPVLPSSTQFYMIIPSSTYSRPLLYYYPSSGVQTDKYMFFCEGPGEQPGLTRT